MKWFIDVQLCVWAFWVCVGWGGGVHIVVLPLLGVEHTASGFASGECTCAQGASACCKGGWLRHIIQCVAL